MSRFILVTLVLILVGGLALGYGYLSSSPREAEVTGLVPPIPAVDPGLLTNPTVQKIKQLELNGQVPVQVPVEELGRDDPFAGF